MGPSRLWLVGDILSFISVRLQGPCPTYNTFIALQPLTRDFTFRRPHKGLKLLKESGDSHTIDLAAPHAGNGEPRTEDLARQT